MIIFAAFFSLRCGADTGNPDPNNKDPFVYNNNIFTRTTTMSVAARVVTAGQPSFSWSATGQKHVVCAVFSERIQVKNNQITNTNKVVWLWHTGIGRGREGNVLYENGISGSNAPLDQIPQSLKSGTYFWGAWVLDEGGTPVRSTIENTLTIP